MQTVGKDSRVSLAAQAVRGDRKLTIRAAAKLYSVNHATLARRLNGQPSRRDITPNSRKLTDLEESAIVNHILDLDSRAFPPRLSGVEEMANHLLATRRAPNVGKNWASAFVKRRSELAAKFSRRYDYQRALCEDGESIQGWFQLVQNTIAKYGISETDIYSFDETGFMIGMVSASMVVTNAERRGRPKLAQQGNREWITVIQGVNSQDWTIPPFIIVKGQYHMTAWYEDSDLPKDWVMAVSDNGWTTDELGLQWIRHFNEYSRGRTAGKYRLLVLDGHASHHSAGFEVFCRENNIVTLCMPAHSSHLLQPLDVGCFSPLKRAYGRQVEILMRAYVTHVTKLEFFSAFKAAFSAAMIAENVRGGFRGAGLVPYNPESVASKLDITPKTSTPVGLPVAVDALWESKTPQNPTEVLSQSEYIKRRIETHQSSSQTSIYNAVDQVVKGTQTVMHSVALLKDRIALLEEANFNLSKRRRSRKTRGQHGGSSTLQSGRDSGRQKKVRQQAEQESRTEEGQADGTKPKGRRC